jgi:Protein of unknown function (DUF2905)
MSLGRILLGLGILFLCVGGVVMLMERANLPVGRLPGDIVWKGKNSAVYFPIVTCIVLSVVGTLVMWVIRFFTGRN